MILELAEIILRCWNIDNFELLYLSLLNSVSCVIRRIIPTVI